MKTAGYVLIAAGFLAGALVSVLDPEHVSQWPLVTALVVGFAGVAIVRIGRRRAAGGQERLAADVEQLGDLLDRVVANIGKLRGEGSAINTYDMRHHIDSLITTDVHSFADGRQSIAAAAGLAAYAEIMGHFAAGERYLNRAWSASADGYVDEVTACMEKSHGEFAASLRRLRSVSRSSDSPTQ